MIELIVTMALLSCVEEFNIKGREEISKNIKPLQLCVNNRITKGLTKDNINKAYFSILKAGGVNAKND